LTRDIDSGTESFRRYCRSRDPLFIRRLIPCVFKEAILDIIRYRNGATALNDICPGDFIFSESNLSKARYFIVVCRHPK